MRWLVLAAVTVRLWAAGPPSADEIVRRAAENQRRAQEARKAYVYDMDVFVRLKRANGKVAREESRQYVVVPGPKGASRKMVELSGKVVDGKKIIPYTEARFEHGKPDIDGALTDSVGKEILWRKSGFGQFVQWYPGPNSDDAGRFRYKFDGEERFREYDVYKISFSQKRKDSGQCWSGEVLVEKTEFQPVMVSSHWDCKIPLAVQALLGTNVSQIGSKVTYQRFDKDVWFPVSCGGEMKLRVLFLYARTIAFTAANKGFRKADVQTTVEFETQDGDKSENGVWPTSRPSSLP